MEYNKQKKNLLIVDDDDDLLVLFFLAMRSKGYEVEVSRNAETFWDDMKAKEPDVIVLDIHMPGIDGRTLCKLLKEDRSTAHIPVIMLSANDNIDSIAAGCGANGYLRKPFNSDKLVSEVERIAHHIE